MHSHWRDCQAWRDEGLPLSSSSNEACKFYDATLSQYVGWYDDASVGGVGGSLKAMKEADPNFAMGQVLALALELMATGRSPRLDDAFQSDLKGLASLSSASDFLTSREKAHIKAVEHLGAGMMDEACDVWESILVEHPTDILALKLGQDSRFYLGKQTEMRDSLARVFPRWKSTLPLYGYLYGMKTFGLCETSFYAEAEAAGKKALEINQKDSWAIHGLAHTYEMQGRYNDGIHLLDSTQADWSNSGGLTCHNFWHWGVYHIEKGEYHGAFDIFDSHISPTMLKSRSLINIVDASSLLYRLQMEGENVEGRWDDLYDVCLPHKHDHLQPFYDSHLLMSFLCSGHKETATEMMESMKSFVKEVQGTRYGKTSDVSVKLCESLVAYDNGEYEKAVDLLYPIRYKIVTLGGSHAQRDIFNLFLIHAALQSPNAYHNKLARSLLEERKALKQDSPLTDRLIARALAAHRA